MPDQPKRQPKPDRHLRDPISVRPSPADWAWLDEQCEATGRPVRALIADAIREKREREAAGMDKSEAIEYIAKTLGYGYDNAADWTLHAAFHDSWTHPAGALIVTWHSATNTYRIHVPS